MIVLDAHIWVWFEQALAYPDIRLLALTPRIALESTRLPGTFHRDPADQLIVATARVYDCPPVTVDERSAPTRTCRRNRSALLPSALARPRLA